MTDTISKERVAAWAKWRRTFAALERAFGCTCRPRMFWLFGLDTQQRADTYRRCQDGCKAHGPRKEKP